MKITIILDVNQKFQIASAWVNKCGDTIIYRPDKPDNSKRYEITVDVSHSMDAEKIDCVLKEAL